MNGTIKTAEDTKPSFIINGQCYSGVNISGGIEQPLAL